MLISRSGEHQLRKISTHPTASQEIERSVAANLKFLHDDHRESLRKLEEAAHQSRLVLDGIMEFCDISEVIGSGGLKRALKATNNLVA